MDCNNYETCGVVKDLRSKIENPCPATKDLMKTVQLKKSPDGSLLNLLEKLYCNHRPKTCPYLPSKNL
jgi:hypothetical protein